MWLKSLLIIRKIFQQKSITFIVARVLAPLQAHPDSLKTPHYLESLLELMSLLNNTNSNFSLYTWLAALLADDTFSPSLVCRRIHGLCFGLADRKPERRARSDDHCIIMFNPPDDRYTMPPSSAYGIPLKLSTSFSSFPLRVDFACAWRAFFSLFSFFFLSAPCFP